MENLTIEQAIEHLKNMVKLLEKYKEKYPKAKFK